ncbi:MPT63 family protein [Mycolicibacter sinensis]|jgi:hypothetical protein|uniref:MPT63-like domain-containing protein n=1 Tax=Mycolicibacter sinensis (strain JDM601) TaxID=875328 RepID=A0A1A2EPG2_MYCSD|nr:MPT63 family protein [Mycolicibacter sinensis]OBF99104.1 hypothetical protein A5772_13075 [Mycolicibacter sinensis]OBG06000.1 hypothetical protein A5771_09155 [Mycolicibacter sinensis]
MKLITTAVAAAGALTVAGALSIPTAGADAGDAAPTTHPLGTQGTVDNNGVIQGWTVSDLRPSTDAVPYQPHGTLWEATATDVAIQGNVTPVIANLGARSASGQTYPALFTVATPQGVNPSTLAQGEKTSGKVYFDVTGDAPNSAVYQFAGKDQLIWTPAASTAPSGGSSAPTGAAGHSPAATSPKPAQSGTQTNPAGNQTGSTPAAAGSQGTPLPAEADGAPAAAANTEGTSAAANGSETPASASAGTPEASAPAATGNTPAAAGSSGTPLPAESAGAPAAGSEGTAPASSQGTEAGTSPVPAGSQGTPAAGGANNATG